MMLMILFESTFERTGPETTRWWRLLDLPDEWVMSSSNTRPLSTAVVFLTHSKDHLSTIILVPDIASQQHALVTLPLRLPICRRQQPCPSPDARALHPHLRLKQQLLTLATVTGSGGERSCVRPQRYYVVGRSAKGCSQSECHVPHASSTRLLGTSQMLV